MTLSNELLMAAFFIGGYFCALASVFVVAYLTKPINAGRENVQRTQKHYNKQMTELDM